MNLLEKINFILCVLFVVCYAYQYVYIPVSWFGKIRQSEGVVKIHDFAVLICARNEETVIGDLIECLKQQTYGTEHLTIFVMADNCTDQTAAIAKQHGAYVYERENHELIGKGYALQVLLGNIHQDFPKGFDGYFVFDADNVLQPDFIEQMNKTFSQPNTEVVTCYRNSKNYGANWISAGMGLWFLRESRYLHHPRKVLHLSSNVSGTGFVFSRKVAEEIKDWPFHMLTEDIEFSIYEVTHGRKIAYCKDAELFDEQPMKFSQSWNQRLRWSKGYWQVFGGYGKQLLSGMFHGNFSCFDMTMNLIPAFILSILSLVCNVVLIVLNLCTSWDLMGCVMSFLTLLRNAYALLFLVGTITTVSEWKKIHTAAWKKILYMFTFPIFIFTFLPIAIVSLFYTPKWKPIKHEITAKQMKEEMNHK